ncbi:unnamed protein product [Rotaria socialis]|uniref:TIR domain-containing protein n=2 Tax=Rotaria socialis TaxID=392032 RepID=A0A820SKG6_9BILA|nr:unnamed protein product [Rotaria socialis]CAF4459495.1 unnamed protein product [Rotaria socialis]
MLFRVDNVSSEFVPSTMVHRTDFNADKRQLDIVSKKSTKKNSNTSICETTYLIDDEIQIEFFKKPQFISHLINYIKQETFAIEIEIKQVHSNDEESVFDYTIKFIGRKKQNRVVRNFVKNLFKSIKSKIYHQNIVKTWLFNITSIGIVQNILDDKTHLFTVCQWNRLNSKILEVYYFDDEKFNSFQNLIDIDDIIHNHILQLNILVSTNKSTQIIEFIHLHTNEILSKFEISSTKQYDEEFNENMNQYEQDHMLISVTRNPYIKNRNKTKHIIKIFGYQKLVNEVFQKFKNLFDKYRLRKYKFGQISSEQLEYLANFCIEQLHDIAREFHNDYIKLNIRENQFYAPHYLKNKIENSILNLLSNLKTSTFKSKELHYDIAEKLYLHIKKLAQQNRCYCELALKSKSKSYRIPRSNKNSSLVSKSIIEQSKSFCSSPLVFSQTKLTNGSIEIVMGDIALQNVDIIIISSTSFGLKESLIERAGEIIEQQPSSQTYQQDNRLSSIPFITETTGGHLNCRKILFVNWSLPTIIFDEDYLSDLIQLYISKSIRYVIKECERANLTTQTIAFAVPDSCKHEQILAEEMIEETINQINLAKVVSLKVSFVLLPDQQTLHQLFLNIIQTIQTGKDCCDIFLCPTTTIQITLTCSNVDNLKQCEKRINNYLNRSIFKINLDGFENWNQDMINAFYKYSIDRCTLPKLDNDEKVVLHGPINSVYEVKQKYALIKTLAQEKTNLLSLFSTETLFVDYTIMLSYSPDDSIVSQRLANFLIDEGFSVWLNLNQSRNNEEHFEMVNKSYCIILCISKNYFHDKLCEQEAKYANQIGKCIIPVKVQNYEPIEWLEKLIEKESYFQLFGSENHFNLEYDKLLLKLFQCIANSYIHSFKQASDQSNVLQANGPIKCVGTNKEFDFLLTPDQNKVKYENYIQNLAKSEKGQITDNDKNNLTEKIQDIIHAKENQCRKYLYENKWYCYLQTLDSPEKQQKKDKIKQCVWFNIGILSYKQWLNKIENFKTTLNIAPFTYTGDVNKAIFPMLNEVLRNSYLLLSLRKHYPIEKEFNNLAEQNNNRTISGSFKKRSLMILKHQEEMTCKNLNLNDIDSQTTSIRKSTSLVCFSNNKNMSKNSRKMKQDFKKTCKQQLIVLKQCPAKASLTEKELLDFKFKFAERMKTNEYEFEKFCENYKHSLCSSSKQNINKCSTAIFGPCPFSTVTIESFKTIKTNNSTELPLKFPWNGVFDTKIPSTTWKNPTIVFYFETKSSEAHHIK